MHRKFNYNIKLHSGHYKNIFLGGTRALFSLANRQLISQEYIYAIQKGFSLKQIFPKQLIKKYFYRLITIA